MSMDKEKVEKLKNKQAITCCRFEAGSIINEKLLEDPGLIPDFVDSGLITIPDNILKIGQVLGAKLKVTVDALTPLTPENVENYSAEEGATPEASKLSKEPETVNVVGASAVAQTSSNGMVTINIGKGENINISFPTGGGSTTVAPQSVSSTNESLNNDSKIVAEEELRKLKKEYVKVNSVKIGDKTSFEKGVLSIDKKLKDIALSRGELVEKLDFEIITEKDYSKVSDTIMDVQPIAVKLEGSLGEGVTRVMDNVIIVLTGIDANGKQIGEFGSSEGPMDRNIMWGRPGAPDKGDIFIKVNVVIRAGAGMERPGPLSAHIAADTITQEIRTVLKEAKDCEVVKTEEFKHVRRVGKPKVVVVKEIMGQGAMHDNLILPVEPVGTVGAVPNVDLGNLPIAMTPLELLDGGIHALTCIGPASKETSRHYFREPLAMEALMDEEIDFLGMIIVGSPQVNGEKFYVSKRLGMMVEYMRVDGAIITTEGFGNNHIDFAEHHRSIGQTGAKVVGCTYAAQQGALVVGNEYMYAMIDNNKSKQGIENEILSNNTLCQEDAIRALEMLKTVMAGEEIEEAERRWDANVKSTNVELINKLTNHTINLVPNEQTLEKSKKRMEIYEKE